MAEGIPQAPPTEVQAPAAPPSAEGASIQASTEAPNLTDTLKGVENGTTDVSAEAHQLADQLRNEPSANAALHDLANENHEDSGQQIDAILDDTSLTKDEREEKLRAFSQEKNDAVPDQTEVSTTPAEQTTNTFDASANGTNARLDELRQKSPDELKTLAEGGNILAKKILSEQQASTPTSETPTVTTPDTDNTPPQAESAPQATVDAPTESGETTDAPEVTAENGELTPEEQAKLDGMKIGAELGKLGIDLTTKEGQAFAQELLKHPDLIDKFQKAQDANKVLAETFGPEAAKQSTEATQASLQQQLTEAQAKGDTEGADKIKSLLVILAAIIASLAAAAIVVPGAVAVAAPIAAAGGTAALLKRA